MHAEDPCAPNFLDQKDSRFHELHGTCELAFHQLRQNGVGANPKKVAVITTEEENVLWERGVLSRETPKALQRCVFHYLGKNFSLRGGEEQRGLKLLQLIWKRAPDQYVYIETGSLFSNCGITLYIVQFFQYVHMF